MKIYKFKIQRYYSLLLLTLLICFAGTNVFSQESKNKETGEIVMSAQELESLLTKIAERRKEMLKNNKVLQLPAYQLRSSVNYQDPRMYQDLRNLEYKLDLLLSKANLLPNQGGTTTFVLPQQSPGLTPPSGIATQVGEGNREVLKSHEVFFANNSIIISSEDKRIIADLIPTIKARQNQVLVVLKGFASKVGSAFYNNQLSYNRANAIKQLLVSDGVSPGNIIIMSHGSDRTVRADEARRVEITLELVPYE